jgi:hypothetical protein
MTAFWDIAPCSLIKVTQRFGGAYCLHHQDDVSCGDIGIDGTRWNLG